MNDNVNPAAQFAYVELASPHGHEDGAAGHDDGDHDGGVGGAVHTGFAPPTPGPGASPRSGRRSGSQSGSQSGWPKQLWRTLRRRPGLALAALFVVLLIVAAIHPGALTSGDPLATDAEQAFMPPGPGHVLGTDENGRDVLTRLIYGARPSLLMGLAATAVSLAGGVVLGLLAGLGGRLADSAVMRLIDVLLAFPDLLLALVVIAFWGQGEFNAILAVGLAGIPRQARMVRVQTRLVRTAQFVEAARTLGIGEVRNVLRHVLPNAIKPILILTIISLGGQITAGAALSFLGLGAPPPSPEWGSMLSSGRDFLGNAWWLTAEPGIAITLTVVSITALGRELMRRREGKQ